MKVILFVAANKVMLGVSGEGMQDQEMFNLRSTCHIALDRCEKDGACRYKLEIVSSRRVHDCVLKIRGNFWVSLKLQID